MSTNESDQQARVSQEQQESQDDEQQPHSRSPDDTPATESVRQNRTACLNCRAMRQRCDRNTPCSRCLSQGRQCRYPAGSNRGRKLGSMNKPTTVEKLLFRINESGVRDQVVAALLNSNVDRSNRDLSPENAQETTSAAVRADSLRPSDRQPGFNQHDTEFDARHSLVSPLNMMAAAVAAEIVPSPQNSRPQIGCFFKNQVGRRGVVEVFEERLAKYFAPHTTQQTDWQVLASQSVDHTLKLETTACDPITARLIDQSDVSWYFKLFFKMRNPVVGLLDPALHTPEYVYSASFTLFSVVCALGCAISVRPRDRVLYPALLSLAEGSMKWSIAVSVKSLETIQAIINMQYWAPICQRQSDDPCWLHLSHAAQLARELGIHKPATVADQVYALAPDATADYRERLLRNFERTWLYVFIADKSFGIITGRPISVSWKEIPASVSEWWQKPMTNPHDRVICGIVEVRRLLLVALEQQKRTERTLKSILDWHSHAFGTLDRIRTARCASDGFASAEFLPVLAFYMDHSILVLSAQALRDMTALDETMTSSELSAVSQKAFNVASRVLDLVLSDPVFRELMFGFHNNMYIMICHAVTEILQAIKRGGLTSTDVAEASSKVRAIPDHLEVIAEQLPPTSAANLYMGLSKFFVCKLDNIASAGDDSECGGNAQDPFVSDWWKSVDLALLDSTAWIDMNFLSSEPPVMSTETWDGAEEQGLGDFVFN
ncbi:hypothetical protein BKA56DRAFT_598235 [Ilyonectria sp. MPI-CAGE-AT-0026]|nr:hypothetical protein BKA56DRAFT_598235 [Ilyonectria sp. MPI-CAGE-AT-0026]